MNKRFELDAEELNLIIESAVKRSNHNTAPQTFELIAKERAFTVEQIKQVREDMSLLATKKDIEGVMDFMKDLNVGLGIFRFTWNNAAKIGAFILLLGGIWALFKYGFVHSVEWLLNRALP